MSLMLRFYALVGAVLMWFIFGTIILIRSNKGFDDLKVHEGRVEEIGVTVTRIPVVGKPKDILYLIFEGLNIKLGIYHNSKMDYDFYLNRIHRGDVVKIYFDKSGAETAEGINLHTFQLEKNGEILLSKNNLNRTDKKVGLTLYGVGLLFSIMPIWFYRAKMGKRISINPPTSPSPDPIG